MSAICGAVSTRAHVLHTPMCRAMLSDQAVFGPDEQNLWIERDVTLGRALHRLLPEDRFDLQPCVGGGGRWLMVADLRIDNREEIIALLGPQSSVSIASSDVAILLAAYERLKEDAFARIAGAFAVAVWDRKQRQLVLARDPTGQRPLHYHEGAGFFAFASTPSGLHAAPEIPREPDEEKVVQFLAGLPSEAPRTFFKGIRQVENGTLVIVGADGSLSSRRYWRAKLNFVRLPHLDDYVDAYREQLDQAVRSQLRGADGLVATHLSSGYDSSAVTATAARLLDPSHGRVLAFTAAPREGYAGAVPRGRIADETPIAAETAAQYPNIEHIIMRVEGGSLLNVLDDERTSLQEPVPLLCNNLWWRSINREASARGARVMLIGEAGNVTISAGGIYELAELVRGRRWTVWAKEARALLTSAPVNWRGVLASSFGPWLPLPLWTSIRAAFLGTSSKLDSGFMITRHWQERLKLHGSVAAQDTRPPRNMRAYRLNMMQRLSPGNLRKEALATSGIDIRDPTADKRVVEFCLSLPPEMLLSNGVPRALARRALSDRVPASVLSNRLRGLQLADWHERVSAADAERALGLMEEHDAVRRVIDCPRLREVISGWPSSGWESFSVIGEYRQMVLKALAAAHFLCRSSGDLKSPDANSTGRR